MLDNHRHYIIRSGAKTKNAQGITVIKDGIKYHPHHDSNSITKPAWLRTAITNNSHYQRVKNIVKANHLSTVCLEAKCPNIHECWGVGTATLMLMGSVCTRACRFCAVDTGNPKGWLDLKEPKQAAKAVKLMALNYVVLTSVNRDDLPDGGAKHYAACIREIKKVSPQTAIEALVPDFNGSTTAVQTLLDSGIEVFAQNIETVKRLTHPVRDSRASYEQTLNVLAYAKKAKPKLLTKTSLMLGLGETDEEILATIQDLRGIGVDILTLGQYLRPTSNHLAVKRYVTPQQFQHYRKWGLAAGFLEVVAGTLVRSSYRAERAVKKARANLAKPLKVYYLGQQDYLQCYQKMQSFTYNRKDDTCDEIWMLEHQPIFTYGKSNKAENILKRTNIAIIESNRGGQITYHGPGQLVGYCLIDLQRRHLGIRQFVNFIEQSIITLLQCYHIKGHIIAKQPGVYVNGAKIASLGLRVHKSRSYHGLSLNVNMDLEPFSWINPCGIKNLAVTQLAHFIPDIAVNEVAKKLATIMTTTLANHH